MGEGAASASRGWGRSRASTRRGGRLRSRRRSTARAASSARRAPCAWRSFQTVRSCSSGREGRACRDRRGTDATSASLRRNDSGIVSAASSWARRAVGVLGGVFVGAARRGRRALPCVRHGAVRGRGRRTGGPRGRVRHGAVRGRDRRPRRPAWPCASSAASLGRGAPRTSRPTRCAHARCAHGVRVRRAVCVCGMVRCVVGADVLGGPRARVRPRRRPLGAARVPSVYRFQKERTKMLHKGRFGLAPSTVL